MPAVKKDPVFSSILVIVTTQNDREADEIQALSHGASDFVAKPYRAQIILHRVAGLIHLRETAAMVNLFRQDRLTGLYSKEFFYQRVGEILLEHPEKEYDIGCSDIVNFKLVNDIFGTKTGDRLLRIIADLYTDSAEGRRICGRLNSDQFACLLERREDYTDSMFIEATAHIFLREQSVTDSMAPALSDGRFEIYLQPKYRIKDSRLSGAEALVRWNHPEGGIQSPAEFIPLFEKNGFITKLDEYVWGRTGAVLRKWGDNGYPQQIIDSVGHLRSLGFLIEMDDFGSGYSSLNMLNKMPIAMLQAFSGISSLTSYQENMSFGFDEVDVCLDQGRIFFADYYASNELVPVFEQWITGEITMDEMIKASDDAEPMNEIGLTKLPPIGNAEKDFTILW